MLERMMVKLTGRGGVLQTPTTLYHQDRCPIGRSPGRMVVLIWQLH